MKKSFFLLILLMQWALGQEIHGIQVFNPQTQDETPVIRMGEQLILNFDDFSYSNDLYRYTIKHVDRNWQDDHLFFSEYAEGSMNVLIDDYRRSFNTLQMYTHYTARFPNEKLRPKISGNYVLIVYKDRPENPLFIRRFVIVETAGNISFNLDRYSDPRQPQVRQRLQIGVMRMPSMDQNLQSVTLSVMQNNNWYSMQEGYKPTSVRGNDMLFQQMDLAFPGNNQFFYFDTKNMMTPMDMVAAVSTEGGVNESLLYPVLAYPLNYQYLPDVNGSFYFRRNDNGIERNPDIEGDYTWVTFGLDSDPLEGKEIYVLGKFNEYKPREEFKMTYFPEFRQYRARIYLKQGFYNYRLVTLDNAGNADPGEINGNFWQTANLYQAITYYTDWSKGYDGAASYGELRPVNR